MATVTTFVVNKPLTESLSSKLVKTQSIIDCAVTALTSGDTVQVLEIPAHSLVLMVGWEVLTAKGSAGTGELGDGSDADGWDSSINMNSAAGGNSAAGTDAYGIGKYYVAEDTIDFHPAQNNSTGKIVFCAIYATIKTA